MPGGRHCGGLSFHKVGLVPYAAAPRWRSPVGVGRGAVAGPRQPVRGAQVGKNKEKRNEKNKDSRDIQEKLIKAGSLITVEELSVFRTMEDDLTKKQNIFINKIRIWDT